MLHQKVTAMEAPDTVNACITCCFDVRIRITDIYRRVLLRAKLLHNGKQHIRRRLLGNALTLAAGRIKLTGKILLVIASLVSADFNNLCFYLVQL